MNAETSERSNSGLLEFLCRHLIGLHVTYRYNNPEDEARPPRFAVYSGTLIFIRDTLMYLTAGHVLKELDQVRQHDQVQIEHAELADIWGWNRVSDKPIPFDLTNAKFFYVDDADLGLDFGVITLDPHHGRLLAKNGVLAITEDHWIRQHEMELDRFFMLGFPKEYTSERVSASGHVSVSPVLLSVSRIEAPPEGREPTRLPQFIG